MLSLQPTFPTACKPRCWHLFSLFKLHKRQKTKQKTNTKKSNYLIQMSNNLKNRKTARTVTQKWQTRPLCMLIIAIFIPITQYRTLFFLRGHKTLIKNNLRQKRTERRTRTTGEEGDGAPATLPLVNQSI